MPAKKIDEILKSTTIVAILRPKLVTGLHTLSVQAALDLMRAQQSGYIVVLDEQDRVVGLFTERDVLMKILRKGIDLSQPLSPYVNRDVKCLTKQDSLWTAIEVMNEKGIRHVPLVKEDNVVDGVLSVRTVVTFLAELFPTEVFNLPPKSGQFAETRDGG